VALLHDGAFINDVLNHYLPDLKFDQAIRAQNLYGVLGLQLTGCFDLDLERTLLHYHRDAAGVRIRAVAHDEKQKHEHGEHARADQNFPFIHMLFIWGAGLLPTKTKYLLSYYSPHAESHWDENRESN